LFLTEELENNGSLYIATEDGSTGTKGTVIDAIKEQNVEGDVISCIHVLDEIVMQGRELGQFVNDFIWYLRNLMLIKTSDQAAEIIDASAERIQALKEEAQMVDTDVIMRYIRIFSELSNQIKYSSQKRVLIEIALIKLTKPAMEQDIGSLNNRISIMEKKIESGDIATTAKTVVVEKSERTKA